MRTIDADKLVDMLYDNEFAVLCPLDEVSGVVDACPTVDAVIVTRCKDCKHKGWVQEPCHGKSVDYCKVWDCTLRNLESTFCSYGERKDGGAE
jgi:hypothetical protein